MIYILISIIVILLAALILLYFRTARLLENTDKMLDDVLDGHFVEESFNEQKLSKIEGKLYRYLAGNEQVRRNTIEEKNAIKALVSDISHQTKTPIANILLYTQLLKESGSSEAEEEMNGDAFIEKSNREHMVCQIEEQTRKLNFLIQSLVKLSRLENGIVLLNPVKNGINALLDVTEYEQAAAEKGVRLLVQDGLESTEMTAVFDRKWTKEAIANILDNAIKYTPAGGCVSLSATEYEMFVRIDIRDTGIGMTEEETARVFTRFYRSPRVGDEKGVGIGLYLAREILSREKGYIKVESEMEKGSVFSVFLPKNANLSKL